MNLDCTKCRTTKTYHKTGLCAPCRASKCKCGADFTSKKLDQTLCFKCIARLKTKQASRKFDMEGASYEEEISL